MSNMINTGKRVINIDEITFIGKLEEWGNYEISFSNGEGMFMGQKELLRDNLIDEMSKIHCIKKNISPKPPPTTEYA